MSDLVEFLNRCIDEDERIASAATPGPWRYDQGKHWRKPGTSWFEEAVFAGPDGADAICVAGTGETDDWQSMADAEHVALHDPARVLREVEAKRRLLKPHSTGDFPYDPDGDGPGNYSWTERCDECYKPTPCPTVRALASAYSDRPGYDPSWAHVEEEDE